MAGLARHAQVLNAIDSLPEPYITEVMDYIGYLLGKAQSASNAQVKTGQREALLKKRRRGFEILKKYSGTMHLDKPWKEELYEALDEKYNRAD
jgi:hypothetical protein